MDTPYDTNIHNDKLVNPHEIRLSAPNKWILHVRNKIKTISSLLVLILFLFFIRKNP